MVCTSAYSLPDFCKTFTSFLNKASFKIKEYCDRFSSVNNLKHFKHKSATSEDIKLYFVDLKSYRS